MSLKTLGKLVNVSGKKVLIRIDANVPIRGGKVVEGTHGKIARVAVDLEWFRQRGARTIVVTHLGRPEGKHISAYSVRPVAKRLSELLGVKVAMARGIVGSGVQRAVERMRDGDILLLENVRFDAREEQNGQSLARELASLADLYVNDAFSVSHRAHASVEAITEHLPSYAGPLLANEVNVLDQAIHRTKQPLVLAMGGLKMETKLPIMERLLETAEFVLIGGALATVFFKAKGFEVGKSIYDEDGVLTAERLLESAGNKLILPVDVVVASSFRKDARTRDVSPSEVMSQERIVDVGRDSVALFAKHLKKAKTIIWNGPFGYNECAPFAQGTIGLAKAIAARTGKATTIVGGGDTVPLLEEAGLADRFTLLSTGGGAMLEFLAGKKLPGIRALEI